MFNLFLFLLNIIAFGQVHVEDKYQRKSPNETDHPGLLV